jgi:hypothetical protein
MSSKRKRPAHPRLERGLFVIILLVVCAVILYVADQDLRDLVRPYHCLFYQLSGMLCPACGATRAMIHLFNGNILLALKSNALAVFILPLLTYALILIIRVIFDKNYSIYQIRIAPFFIWSLFVLVLVFWVVRNLPGFSFLRPI